MQWWHNLATASWCAQPSSTLTNCAQVHLCGAVLIRQHTSVVVIFDRSAEELRIYASKSSLGNLETCEECTKAGIVLWQQHALSAEYRGA